MKSKPREKAPLTKPLLSDLMERDKAGRKALVREAFRGVGSFAAADLDQDAGNGYNPDFTFPQE